MSSPLDEMPILVRETSGGRYVREHPARSLHAAIERVLKRTMGEAIRLTTDGWPEPAFFHRIAAEAGGALGWLGNGRRRSETCVVSWDQYRQALHLEKVSENFADRERARRRDEAIAHHEGELARLKVER